MERSAWGRRGMKRFSFLGVVLGIGVAFTVGAAYDHPVWRIPRLSMSPVIDGVIGEEEYASVPAITGMVTWGGPGGAEKSVVANEQQVTWFVSYDAEYFYLAMRSPHPPGTWPAARVKEDDDGAILWDDHTEIQIATQGRRNYSAPGKGFYKIMTNAKGTLHDMWYFNGTPGTEQDWSIIGEHKVSVTESRWEMELKISLAALQAPKDLEGESWVMQLLRADAPGGVYFAGWVGEAWMAWGDFGEIVFDADAPVFRFLETGELAKGRPRLGFEILGGSEEAEIEVTVTARDPQGGELFREHRQAVVAPGGLASMVVEREVNWPSGRNRLHILATARLPAEEGAAEGELVTLYEVELPVKSLVDPVEWAARVEPWLQQKPRSGEPEWRFAYWPTHGIAETSVDLDFFGMPEAVAGAGSFAVSIRPWEGEAVASAIGRIEGGRGRLLVNCGRLGEGEYVAEMKLLNDGGEMVGEVREVPFVRRHYEWEGNALGQEEVVFPPFKPIKVEEREGRQVLSPILRSYTIGDMGLPMSIEAEGGAGRERLLERPIHLTLVHGGQELALSDPHAALISQSESQVVLRSLGQMGDFTLIADTRMLFDGYYDVELFVTPPAGGGTIDSLTLVLPLWKGADTMYVQRGADTFAGGNKMDAIPAGQGVVWHSGMLQPVPRNGDVWRTFAPIVHAGNGDKGLWWFADDNRDWVMSEKRPAVEVVRNGAGLVEVHIHFIGEPVEVKQTRRFHFGLLADPVKKMLAERVIGWGHQGPVGPGWYAHSTFGWRQWGRSSDGYYMEQNDREALRQMLQGLRAPGRPLGGFRQDAEIAARRQLPITLYGSTKNMMMDLPSFDTYGGEWLGNTQLRSQELAAKSNGFNMQGSYESTLKRDQHEIGVNWVQSQVDCFVWYHYQLLRDCPVNGTWWDNRSSFQIKDYDPRRQEFYWRWNTGMRRELTRRLNTIGWQLNRRPWWIGNMHVDWSFNQVAWHIENDFYVDGPTNTLLDQMSVHQFRSYARLKRGIIHRLASRYGGGEASTQAESRRRSRNIIGLCLLHDIGAYRWGTEYAWEHQKLPELLDEAVGFFSEDAACPFTGYWRSGEMVKVDTPEVYCSIYHGKGKAALVILNGNNRELDVEFELLPALLGRVPASVRDAESGYAFRTFWNPEKRVREWGEYAGRRLELGAHDLRILIVE